MRDKTRWLFAAADPDGGLPETDSPNMRGNYHGTSMLSLVTGKLAGVAKKVAPIIVRLPNGWAHNDAGERGWRGFTPEIWSNALSKVLDDLGSEHRTEASAVVLLADYYPRGVGGDPVRFTQRVFA